MVPCQLSLIRPGCLNPNYRSGSGQYLNMFYIYVSSGGLDSVACADRAEIDKYAGITQTSWGGLSVKNKGYNMDTVKT